MLEAVEGIGAIAGGQIGPVIGDPVTALRSFARCHIRVQGSSEPGIGRPSVVGEPSHKDTVDSGIVRRRLADGIGAGKATKQRALLEGAGDEGNFIGRVQLRDEVEQRVDLLLLIGNLDFLCRDLSPKCLKRRDGLRLGNMVRQTGLRLQGQPSNNG